MEKNGKIRSIKRLVPETICMHFSLNCHASLSAGRGETSVGEGEREGKVRKKNKERGYRIAS